MIPLRCVRGWQYDGADVRIPAGAPIDIVPPPTLADVPPEWTRRPQSPPNPPRPGGR
jgi:hypothetical protein